MSGEPVPTSIRILDKDYVVSCPDGEQDALYQSAAFLSGRMQEAKEGGNVIGTERIAVMAALHLVHDYLGLVRERDTQSADLESVIQRLEEKLGASIAANRSPT